MTAYGTEVIVPVVPEVTGLFAGSILVSGMRFDIWITEGKPPERAP